MYWNKICNPQIQVLNIPVMSWPSMSSHISNLMVILFCGPGLFYTSTTLTNPDQSIQSLFFAINGPNGLNLNRNKVKTQVKEDSSFLC